MASNIRDLSPSRNPFLDPPSFDEESDSDTEDRTAAAVLVSLRSQHGSSAINSVSASASSSLSRRSPSLSQSSLSTTSPSSLQTMPTSMSSVVSATNLQSASDLSMPAPMELPQSNSSTPSSSLEGIKDIDSIDSAVKFLIQSKKPCLTGALRIPDGLYDSVITALAEKGLHVKKPNLSTFVQYHQWKVHSVSSSVSTRASSRLSRRSSSLSQSSLPTSSPSSLQATSTSTISAVSATSLQPASDLSMPAPMELSSSSSSEGLEGIKDINSAVDFLVRSKQLCSTGAFRMPKGLYKSVQKALEQKAISVTIVSLKYQVEKKLKFDLSQSSLPTSSPSSLQAMSTSTNSAVSATILQRVSDLPMPAPMELSSSSSLARSLEGVKDVDSAVDFLIQSRKRDSAGTFRVPNGTNELVLKALAEKGIYSTTNILKYNVAKRLQKNRSVTSSVLSSASSSSRSRSLSQSSLSTSLQSSLQATSTSSAVSATSLQPASDLSMPAPMELSQSNSSTPSSSLASSLEGLEGVKDVYSAVDFLIQSRKECFTGIIKVRNGVYNAVQKALEQKGIYLSNKTLRNKMLRRLQESSSVTSSVSSTPRLTRSPSGTGYGAKVSPITSLSPNQPVQVIDLSVESSSSGDAIDPVTKKHKS